MKTSDDTYEELLHRLTSGGRQCFSVNEAAHALRLSKATLWNMFKRGELSPKRIGGRTLVPATEIARLLTQ
jgi:excisionase family DNA binding protein